MTAIGSRAIGTCLWFDGRAEEAANFYAGLFDDGRILDVARYGDAGPGDAGSVMTVSFELGGRGFRALNGGPEYTFNEAVSFELFFDTQQELDDAWSALTAGGGEDGPCGWLKDKFGVSWQLIPNMLMSVLGGSDPAGRERAMAAMLAMHKLDIAALQAAYDGGA
ncbi:VOC family protein [Specibacter cremeus]|uniref:VOC family protein n=1 Tax=Specibacter cremeus TaxID=1629051 RepID=UPI000F7B510F|nr:VOC family protein [Specibacter cremeus]